jgi:glycyl-tRNA synthetase (class II)
MKDDVVTVRHRDSMQQERVAVKDLVAHLYASMETWQRPAR